MISGVNYSNIGFNGYCEKMSNCDLRTPMERTIMEIKSNIDTKAKYIKKTYSNSPLVVSELLNRIYEEGAEKIAAVQRQFSNPSTRFTKIAKF